MTSKKAQAHVTLESSTCYRCEGCEAISEDCGGPIYECSNCGEKQIDERQCASCGKFSAKLGDLSCVECEDSEVEEVEAFHCESCDNWYEA